MENDGPKPPRPAAPATPAIEAGAIYIRWRERLWQEQPDGSYLVWDEESREWQESDVQPPRAGKTVSTRECPNCGRRVRTTLRSCPYCEYGFVEEAKPVPGAERREAQEKAKKAEVSRQRMATPIAILIIVVLLGGLAFGVVKYKQSRDCRSWKDAVKAYTDTAISLDGLPEGVTEQQFRELNEARFADTKPGGCA